MAAQELINSCSEIPILLQKSEGGTVTGFSQTPGLCVSMVTGVCGGGDDDRVLAAMRLVTMVTGGCGRESVALGRGYCGNSVTGLFCLRVSMRDRTPLFTLVETRRDTESPGGDEPQAFWEGGRATKHF